MQPLARNYRLLVKDIKTRTERRVYHTTLGKHCLILLKDTITEQTETSQRHRKDEPVMGMAYSLSTFFTGPRP